MKKIVFNGIIILFLAVGAIHAQELNLKETIIRAARDVEAVLPQGTKVAVLNFTSPSDAFSNYVIEELTGELVTGRKVTIVDRQSLALIREEMNLQLSGDVSDESAQAIGKMLGAQSIISGSLTDMRTHHRFRIRVISVETAAIQTQVSLDLRNDAQVAYLLSGENAPATSQRERQPGTPREKPQITIGNDRTVVVSLGLGGYGGLTFNTITGIDAVVEETLADYGGGNTLVRENVYYVDGDYEFGNVNLAALGFVNLELFSYALFDLSFYFKHTERTADNVIPDITEYSWDIWGLQFSILGQYPVNVGKRLTLFPLAGVGFDWRVYTKENKSGWEDDGGNLMVKLGGGMRYNFTEHWRLNIKLMYDILFHFPEITSVTQSEHGPNVTIGIGYVF